MSSQLKTREGFDIITIAEGEKVEENRQELFRRLAQQAVGDVEVV